MARGKIVPLTPEQQREADKAVQKAFDEHRKTSPYTDPEAGVALRWPFSYKVRVYAITEGVRIEREYAINAGSLWEAGVFAKRRIRTEIPSEKRLTSEYGCVFTERITPV